MYRFTASFIVLILLVTGAACTKASFTPSDPGQKYAKTTEVKMYRNYPDTVYIEIGTIRVVGPSKDKLLKSVREKAMKIGAQAVVVKPPTQRSNTYQSQRKTMEFGKIEYIMEAVALRFPAKAN